MRNSGSSFATSFCKVRLKCCKVLSVCLLMCRLVNKINNSIGQDPNSKSLIGVLDIYGFESFKTNR